MADFVAVEVISSSSDSEPRLDQRLRRAVEPFVTQTWSDFREGFDSHPITSIFLATLAVLAFLPIVAAATISLFIITFVTCVVVFGGLFVIVVSQLAIALALTILLGILTILAAGVTVSLVTTVIVGQKASLCAARLRSKSEEYDWTKLVHTTSSTFCAITPRFLLNEVTNASNFLVTVPKGDLPKKAGESIQALRKQFPFQKLSRKMTGDGTATSTTPSHPSSPPTSASSSTSEDVKPPQRTGLPPFINLVISFVKAILLVLKKIKTAVDSFLATYAINRSRDAPILHTASEDDIVKVEEMCSGTSTSVAKGKGKETETMILSDRGGKRNVRFED